MSLTTYRGELSTVFVTLSRVHNGRLINFEVRRCERLMDKRRCVQFCIFISRLEREELNDWTLEFHSEIFITTSSNIRSSWDPNNNHAQIEFTFQSPIFVSQLLPLSRVVGRQAFCKAALFCDTLRTLHNKILHSSTVLSYKFVINVPSMQLSRVCWTSPQRVSLRFFKFIKWKFYHIITATRSRNLSSDYNKSV